MAMTMEREVERGRQADREMEVTEAILVHLIIIQVIITADFWQCCVGSSRRLLDF